MDTFFFDLVREPEKVMVATIIIVLYSGASIFVFSLISFVWEERLWWCQVEEVWRKVTQVFRRLGKSTPKTPLEFYWNSSTPLWPVASIVTRVAGTVVLFIISFSNRRVAHHFYFISLLRTTKEFVLNLIVGSFTSILGDESWERILTKVTSIEQTLTVRSSTKSICFRLFRLQKFRKFARRWSSVGLNFVNVYSCLLYTSPSPRDA